MSTETQEPRQAPDEASALNRDILDALSTLIKQAGTVGHDIAGGFKVAPHDLLAMFKLDCGTPMKELAQRMGCDASFITTIADNLEKRGFLHREPGQRDRRVKYLYLTEDGIAAKERMLSLFAEKMPWGYALSEEERGCFLALLQKMTDAPRPAAAPGDDPEAGE